MKLLSFLMWFIPPALRQQPEQFRRAHVLVGMLLFMWVAHPVYSLIYWLYGHTSGSLVIFSVGLAMVLYTFFLRLGTGLFTVTNLFSGTFLAMLTYLATTMGGLTGAGISPFILSLCLPLGAVSIAGIRYCLIWAVVVALAWIGVYVAGRFGTEFGHVIVGDQDPTFTLIHFVGILTMVTCLGVLFEILRQQAIRNLDTEKASIQTQVEEATAASESERAYLADCVERILGHMERFAQGDLTVTMVHDRDDDIGRLCTGFNRAVQNLRETIARVSVSVETTGEASRQISELAGELAAGAGQQREMTEDMTASVENLAALASENNLTASETAEIARESGQTAQESGRVVGDTLSKVEQIAAVFKDLERLVSSLETSSRQIGDIVQVIETIASQTNLLALNASIESASAGEHGRGFGVVAEEVKRLAEQITHSVKDIHGKVERIQEETGQVVGSMHHGVSEIDASVVLANRASDAIETVIGKVENASGRVGQIADSTGEQTRVSSRVAGQIEEINRVSRDAVSGSSRIAEASENLSQNAETLRSLLEELTIA